MSKGVWARLMKQQQESTQRKSDDFDYQLHKYKDIISSKEQQFILAQPQHMNANILYNTTLSPASTASAASSPSAISPSPISDSILQVAVHDQVEIRASRLLQIVRRWKTKSGAKQIPTPTHRSTTRSPSRSMLNFVPLSCITFPSLDLHSDLEEEEDDDDMNWIHITSDPCGKSTKIRPPQLNHRSSSAHTAQISSHKSPMKTTQCNIGKERDASRRIRAPARRALSCPKLSSPLRTCTAFPSMHADEQEGEEELECLQPKQEDSGRIKLKRSSSSSPLRRYNMLRKQASTPKGYLALYVGEERRRFLVKANLLNHPLFSILLEKAKEEFGFDQKGPLNIPCDIAFFKHIMFLVQSNDPSYKNADHSSVLLHFNSANQLAAS